MRRNGVQRVDASMTVAEIGDDPMLTFWA